MIEKPMIEKPMKENVCKGCHKLFTCEDNKANEKRQYCSIQCVGRHVGIHNLKRYKRKEEC